jgi:RNA recognition motif-containing protein
MNLHVGNLSKEVTEDEVRQAFSRFGEVSSIQIVRDRETGSSRGFAFVEMPNAPEAKNAMRELDLTQIAGRAMTVSEARPRAERRGGSQSRSHRSW